jgi:hypothetical protein
MKKLLLFIFLLLPIMAAKNANEPIEDCKCKGIKLYGKVRVVERHEDLKVRIVETGEDFRVRSISYNPDKCGQWRFVESGEDLKIRFVESSEDLKIRFVDFDPY